MGEDRDTYLMKWYREEEGKEGVIIKTPNVICMYRNDNKWKKKRIINKLHD